MCAATFGTQWALSKWHLMTLREFYYVKIFVKINMAWERTKKNKYSVLGCYLYK